MFKICGRPEHTEDVVECGFCTQRAEAITMGEVNLKTNVERRDD